MPSKYKEPLIWEHKKSWSFPYYGNMETEVLASALKTVPRGSEIKMTLRWSKNQTKKAMDKLQKQ